MERIDEVFNREERILAEEGKRGIEIDRRLFYMLTPNEMPDPNFTPTPDNQQ